MSNNYEIDLLSSEFVDLSSMIIPIIGDGVVFYKCDGGNNIPLLQYVINRFKEDYPKIKIPNKNRADLFILTCFSHELNNYPLFQAKYKKYIQDAKKGQRIEIDPVVLDFLTAFRFPVIITTSCFNYIEEAINKNIASNKYKSIFYNPKDDNSILLDHSIYHLFGNAEEKFRDWVYNEDVLLDFIHSLHSDNYSCKNLCEYVTKTKSSMMILGCVLPDWLFRFLWYTIRCPEEKTGGGYWLVDGNLNIELSHFLKNIDYSPIDTVYEFLIKTTYLKRKEQTEETTQNMPKEYDFFISYAGEDELIAKKLYENLQAMGFTVWYDKRGDSEIKPGDKYVKKFAKGIQLSRRAVTIITEHYIKGVQDPKRGLCMETNLIKQKALSYIDEGKESSFCIPLLIEGRTFNNKKLETSFVENWAGYVSSVEGGLAELFEGTNIQVTDAANPQLPSNI